VLTYATTEDLTIWMDPDPAPGNAGALLRSASGLVRSSTKMATYATDTDGYPTDTALRTVFREAVCAQAKYWADHKVDPSLGAAGVKPAATSKSIGSASITYAPGASAEDVLGLAPDAHTILANAGLRGGTVRLL
jgi:hypothetical protein